MLGVQSRDVPSANRCFTFHAIVVPSFGFLALKTSSAKCAGGTSSFQEIDTMRPPSR